VGLPPLATGTTGSPEDGGHVRVALTSGNAKTWFGCDLRPVCICCSSDSRGGNLVAAGPEETFPPFGGKLFIQSCPAITKPCTVWAYQR
jgi:hypothetical protein